MKTTIIVVLILIVAGVASYFLYKKFSGSEKDSLADQIIKKYNTLVFDRAALIQNNDIQGLKSMLSGDSPVYTYK